MCQVWLNVGAERNGNGRECKGDASGRIISDTLNNKHAQQSIIDSHANILMRVCLRSLGMVARSL